MGGKSGSPKQRVANYYMSIHLGICTTADRIREIFIKERSAWQGDVSSEQDININKQKLFGGLKKEGGVQGTARVLLGAPEQLLPANLSQRFGGPPNDVPAFRGLTTLFFTDGLQRAGFYWGSNTPFIPPVWVTVERAPKGLDATEALIGPDANPAHIIFECLTNDDWGMGASEAIIDRASFNAASATLVQENFGLSMVWAESTSIENFISEVIDHIEGVLFTHPGTGLLTLRLIRDDYNPDTLRVINPDNAKLTNFQRKGWGETTNEIVVTWTNPVNEKEETVSIQDLANITMQGEVVSDGREYYGVRNADLALKLAARDLRVAAAPAASADIEMDRTGWDLLPGEVVRVDWPEYKLSNVVMRVGQVNYGKSGQPSIKFSVVEDVFALGRSDVEVPPGTSWIDPAEEPRPLEFIRVFSLPYYMTLLALGQVETDGVMDAYPDTLAGFLATQTGEDTPSYLLQAETPLPEGGTTFADRTDLSIVSRAELIAPLIREAESVVASFANLIGDEGPQVSGFIWIGDADDDRAELVLISASGASGWTLKRGMLDTVPRAWPAGTLCWFLNEDLPFFDPASYAGEANQRFKFLPRTSLGQLEDDVAPIVSVLLRPRAHLPHRPANIVVDNSAFGPVVVIGSDILATWSRRNRLLEGGQLPAWDDPDVTTPEATQVTNIRIYDDARTLLAAHDDLPGNSFQIPITSFDVAGRGTIEFSSARIHPDPTIGRLESLQSLAVEWRGFAEVDNLIENPRFEDGTFDGWTTEVGAPTVSNQSGVFPIGIGVTARNAPTYSVRNGATPTDVFGQEYVFAAGLYDGSTAYLDASVAAAVVGGGSAEITLTALSATDAVLGSVSSGAVAPTPQYAWRRQYLELAIPVGTAKLKTTVTFLSTASAAGEIFVDNFRLRIGTLSLQLLLNNSFETGDTTNWRITNPGIRMFGFLSDYQPSDGEWMVAGGSSDSYGILKQLVSIPAGFVEGDIITLASNHGSTHNDNDRTIIFIDILDGSGTRIIRHDPGFKNPGNNKWLVEYLAVPIPAGAVEVEISVEIDRESGSANNAQVDGIELRFYKPPTFTP